jgi:hypothetical protein
MKERFLKSKKLQGIGGAVLAAIILLIVFLVVAEGSPTAELSEGGATVGGGFGIHQVGFYQ